MKAHLPSSILDTWHAHLNLLDLITLAILGKRNTLWIFSLWSLLHSSFASLLGPIIRLRNLFWQARSLHSSLNLRDHVSEPCITTGNSIVLYILIFTFHLYFEREYTNMHVLRFDMPVLCLCTLAIWHVKAAPSLWNGTVQGIETTRDNVANIIQ